MPIYEYRCASCDQVSTFLTRSINASLDPVCQHCQGRNLERRISSFALGRGTAAMPEPSGGAGGNPLHYYRDPRNIGRHVEESFHRHGVAMPSAVRDTIDSARQGNLPKQLDP